MGIVFRDAAVADAALLSGLARTTFVETFGHLYRPQDLADFLETHSEPAWREHLLTPELAVRLVESDGTAIAYATIGPKTLPVDSDGPMIQLHHLYVLAPWQGSGIAHRLMEWVLDQARSRGAEEVYLSVFCENHRARRFYERYGFRFVAPYAFMVGEQADEDHILCLKLDEA